jgi:hypothetical protein
MTVGIGGQGSGIREAKKAFSLWHLAFRKFSCFCLSQFSKLFRHSREGGNPSPDGNVYQFFAAESADGCHKIRRWVLFMQHLIFLYLLVMDPRFHGDDGKRVGMTEILYGFLLDSVSLFYFTFSDDYKKWRRA